MPNQSRHSVLVVEDMTALREHFAETIAELEQVEAVDQAVDGVAALELIEARKTPYDLIVTDLTMPRMDGHVLVEKLRQRGYPAAVIVLTAHGQDEMIIRALRGGACDYLVKPLGIDELQVAVATALRHMPRLNSQLDVDYDPQGWFEVSGESSYSVLYRYRKFLSLLESFHLPEQVASEVRLALEELGRNAIEWGNAGDVSKRIRLSCRILPYKIIVQIADEGEGFDPATLPDPRRDPFGHIEQRHKAGKRLGGYGIHLIKNIMDKVAWNPKGNVVVAIKYLHPSGGHHVPETATASQ